MTNRWGNNGKSDRLYFGEGSKITVVCDWSHEIKRHVFLFIGRKAITNLDSILKSRDIILPTKICLVKAMIFPVVMYGCKSCTIKKAEHQRFDGFELWCWKRLPDSKEIQPVLVLNSGAGKVPWTARRSNQSILKEINPEYSLEGLMLKLKLQYFDCLIRRTDPLEKSLMLARLKQEKMTEDEMAGWNQTQWTWVWANSGVGDGQGSLACCSPWGHKDSDTTEQ